AVWICVVAGVDLLRDGIFSSRLAATALYTTSPSVAYLRIDLRIHHNGKEAARNRTDASIFLA
ncbi:hypothetical protein ACN6UP_002122, partial [Cronobacter sakazakii]